MWNIKKIISKGDYNYAVVPEHPYATNNGYVLEHRIIMENSLKRLLNKDEVIHHINGNRKDNRIENLQVMDRKEHERLHGYMQGKNMVDLICPICKSLFTKPRNKTHLVSKKTNSTCCSKSCGAKFGWMKRDPLKTTEVENAISVNIVREYIVYNHDNTEETN